MRCYLIAEGPADLATLRAVLVERGVEVVEPARVFDHTSDSKGGWLPDVDFLCAVFSAADGWETPASIYLEIGQAVGSGVPVLVVAEPPRRLDAALSVLPVLRIPPASGAVLASHLDLFLESLGIVSAVATVRAVDAAELRSVQNELSAFRDDYLLQSGGEALHTAGQRIEELALRLLRIAGAEAQEAIAVDGGAEGVGDIAAWVPGTERFIPGPLFVDLKIVRGTSIDRASLDRLQVAALSRDAVWSLLLYYNGIATVKFDSHEVDRGHRSWSLTSRNWHQPLVAEALRKS